MKTGRIGSKTETDTLFVNSVNTPTKTENIKQRAVEYFSVKSTVFNERYAVAAAGDLLWVRHEAILEMVRGWGLPSGSRLLDLGCGPGILTRYLAAMGYKGVGVDTSPAMIQCSTKEAKAIDPSGAWTYGLGDVEALPLADGSFDGEVCAGVIDYLPSDDKLLREAARVLRPGGRFVLCVTNKFGYTVSLSSAAHWTKKIPGARTFASWLRSLLVGGDSGVMDFNFQPRKHRAAAARRAMERHGFRVVSDKYVHFSVLPAPFCTLTSKLNLRVDEKLGALDRTPLRVLGSCYILDAVRED